jgi:hypothetical protein
MLVGVGLVCGTAVFAPGCGDDDDEVSVHVDDDDRDGEVRTYKVEHDD